MRTFDTFIERWAKCIDASERIQFALDLMYLLEATKERERIANSKSDLPSMESKENG